MEMESDTEENVGGNKCSICLCSYDSETHRFCSLRCGHTFGSSCVKEWLQRKKQCPTCRERATKSDVRIIYDTMANSRLDEENRRLKARLEELEREKELTLVSSAVDYDGGGAQSQGNSQSSQSQSQSQSQHHHQQQQFKLIEEQEIVQMSDNNAAICLAARPLSVSVCFAVEAKPNGYGYRKITAIRFSSLSLQHQSHIPTLYSSQSNIFIRAATLSCNGSRMATVGSDRRVQLADLETQSVIAEYSLSASPFSIAFIQQDKLLVVGCAMNTLVIVDLRCTTTSSTSPLRVINNVFDDESSSKLPITHVKVVGDGNIYVASRRQVGVLSLDDYRVTRRLSLGPATCVKAFSIDSSASSSASSSSSSSEMQESYVIVDDKAIYPLPRGDPILLANNGTTTATTPIVDVQDGLLLVSPSGIGAIVSSFYDTHQAYCQSISMSNEIVAAAILSKFKICLITRSKKIQIFSTK